MRDAGTAGYNGYYRRGRIFNYELVCGGIDCDSWGLCSRMYNGNSVES